MSFVELGNNNNFFSFVTHFNYLHPLQVENCDSSSRLVVDEDGNDKFGPERVNIIFDKVMCVSMVSSSVAYVILALLTEHFIFSLLTLINNFKFYLKKKHI